MPKVAAYVSAFTSPTTPPSKPESCWSPPQVTSLYISPDFAGGGSMRKLAILGGAIMAVGVSTASGAQEPAVWQGDLFVTAVTSLCTSKDVTLVGDFYRSVYRPNIAPPPESQADEALSLIGSRNAFILEANGKTLRGRAIAHTLVIFSHAEVGSSTTTVDLKITPTKITPSTPSVEIKGMIKNFYNNTGCNITVVGVLGLRPPG
jgi:hypothetical protein